MILVHSKDVYIEPSQLGDTNKKPVTTNNSETTITSSSNITTSTKVTSSSSPSTKTKLNTTTLNEKIEMQTSADQIYETLFDPGRVAAWTKSRPDIFRHVGSKFNLFDGNVTGKILE